MKSQSLRQRCGRSSVGAAGVAFFVALAFAAVVPGDARAASVFGSTLSGASERPDPVSTNGGGAANAMLTGDAGSYVLSYSLSFAGLSSDAIAGHIHYGIDPPGLSPVEQTGPVVHPLDFDFAGGGNEDNIVGEWRFDDAELPLTDALVDSLMDGELYFNIHSANFTGGEIRGQINFVAGGDGDGGTAIPLPTPLLLGLVGLGTAAWAARRRRGA